MRRAAKRDRSEPEIVKALEAVGAQVQRLDLPCDLLVRHRGRIYLIECKTPGEPLKRKDREKQRQFCADWSVPYCWTAEDALRVIGMFHEKPRITETLSATAGA